MAEYDDRDILEVSVGGERTFMSGLAVRLLVFPVRVIRVFLKAEDRAEERRRG